MLAANFGQQSHAIARAPGAHQAVLRTLRSLVSGSGFRIEKVAALLAVMRTIHQPTLIIWGRQDKLVPPNHARILEAKLPQSRTTLFDKCGHLPQLEQPGQFNAAVLDFLSAQDSHALASSRGRAGPTGLKSRVVANRYELLCPPIYPESGQNHELRRLPIRAAGAFCRAASRFQALRSPRYRAGSR
jgi:hypothetical protein